MQPTAAPVVALPNNGGAAPTTSPVSPSYVNPNAAMQVPGYTAPSTITSAQLAPQTPFNVVQPTPTPVYNTSQLGASPITPPLTETAGQQQQTSLSQQLEALTTQDAGKAAFTTTQENNAGIPGLQQAQNDLNTKLTTLKTQAQQIPLIDQNNGVGRMSVAGISGQDTVNLRNNAIQSLAVSAQIDATNGLLSSAQQKVTEAVNQQYGPIEAQMAALEANLKNIANDPQTTIDEKNQAQTQLDAVNAQKDQIAQAKADQTTIYKTANDAASNIASFTPTSEYPTAATAISAISQAKTPTDALNIATATGLTTKASTAAPKIIGDAKGGYYEVQPDGSITPIKAGTGGTGGTSGTAAAQKNDIASAVEDFQTQIQQKGWAGANPDAYNYYKSELIKQYGPAAGTALDAAMKAEKITVDYTNK